MAMTWMSSDAGMQMTLTRDVPERIGATLKQFVREMAERTGLSAAERQNAIYAIHPGGPRILDRVRDALEIDEVQISTSRQLLKMRGNMPSATLPHIWMHLLQSPTIPQDAVVVSLAFGPGLTICGPVMRKVAPG